MLGLKHIWKWFWGIFIIGFTLTWYQALSINNLSIVQGKVINPILLISATIIYVIMKLNSYKLFEEKKGWRSSFFLVYLYFLFLPFLFFPLVGEAAFAIIPLFVLFLVILDIVLMIKSYKLNNHSYFKYVIAETLFFLFVFLKMFFWVLPML